MNREDLQEKFDREISKQGIRIKDANQMKVMENVFDDITLLTLYKLVHKRKISTIGGSISTGKEANVFYGESEEGPVAIKIYRIQSANFRAMNEYIAGDPRFSSVRKSRKDIIFAWTKKEYSNLKRAYDAGLYVPKAYYFNRNILLMEFLGEDEIPYPQLRQVKLKNPDEIYKRIISDMKILFNQAGLVHADLSEFNILYDGENPVIIDMGQAVTPDHPKALAFLMRDIKNINRYFSRFTDVRDEKEIFKEIIGKSRFEP